MFKNKQKDGTVVLQSGLTIEEVVEAAMLAAYPVGSIYMSVSSTNPGTLFGGTWTAWGAGRVPVSLNSGDASFDTVEETGGSKTHVHDLDASGSAARIRLAADNAIWATTKTMPSRAATRTVTGSSNASTGSGTTVGIALEGDSNSASSLPPYIVCYMWKRTA